MSCEGVTVADEDTVIPPCDQVDGGPDGTYDSSTRPALESQDVHSANETVKTQDEETETDPPDLEEAAGNHDLDGKTKAHRPTSAALSDDQEQTKECPAQKPMSFAETVKYHLWSACDKTPQNNPNSISEEDEEGENAQEEVQSEDPEAENESDDNGDAADVEKDSPVKTKNSDTQRVEKEVGLKTTTSGPKKEAKLQSDGNVDQNANEKPISEFSRKPVSKDNQNGSKAEKTKGLETLPEEPAAGEVKDTGTNKKKSEAAETNSISDNVNTVNSLKTSVDTKCPPVDKIGDTGSPKTGKKLLVTPISGGHDDFTIGDKETDFDEPGIDGNKGKHNSVEDEQDLKMRQAKKTSALVTDEMKMSGSFKQPSCRKSLDLKDDSESNSYTLSDALFRPPRAVKWVAGVIGILMMVIVATSVYHRFVDKPPENSKTWLPKIAIAIIGVLLISMLYGQLTAVPFARKPRSNTVQKPPPASEKKQNVKEQLVFSAFL